MKRINLNDLAIFVRRSMRKNTRGYIATEYMRMSTLYWTLNSLKMLNAKYDDLREEVLRFIKSCKNSDGGYGHSIGYPSTIVSTFNALQVLCLFDSIEYDESVEDYVLSMITDLGGVKFSSDGEVDIRCTCCAILILHMLSIAKCGNAASIADVEITMREKIPVDYISTIKSKGFDDDLITSNVLRCYNSYDGGFGTSPGCESHAAFVFCCLASLRSLNALSCVDCEKISEFLLLKQADSGGLFGREYKKPDVCYTFWNISSLIILGKESFLKRDLLINFIANCTDKDGGIAKQSGEEGDIFHTMFALAGLSLLRCDNLKPIDPVFCV